MRVLAIATIVLGVIVFFTDLAAAYAIGFWLDDNVPGEGAPSLLPEMCIAVLAIVIVGVGIAQTVIAMTRPPRRRHESGAPDRTLPS